MSILFFDISEKRLEKLQVFAVIFFILQAVPVSVQLFHKAIWLDDTIPVFGKLFLLARVQPGVSFQDNFLNWLLIALLASVATNWVYQRWWINRTSRSRLLYLARTLVSYRLAISLFAYGLLKFFPVLAPYPSLSNLNTAYGDFSEWKLFSLSLGVVPGYQSFLGGVEIGAGILLLFRKTSSIGAVIALIFLGNVIASNIAYGGGDTVYSVCLFFLGVFVLAFDFPRLFRLLVLRVPAAPAVSPSTYLSNRITKLNGLIRVLIVLVFIGLYGFTTKQSFDERSYQFSAANGDSALTGVYTVERFIYNGKEIAWNPYDSIRWRDVVIEPWPTISIRSNKPQIPFHSNLEHFESAGFDRTYELEGSTGRHYYEYTTDRRTATLSLHNKNPNHPYDSLHLLLKPLSDSLLEVTGTDFAQNRYDVVLKRKNRNYLLEVARKTGRRQRIKL